MTTKEKEAMDALGKEQMLPGRKTRAPVHRTCRGINLVCWEKSSVWERQRRVRGKWWEVASERRAVTTSVKALSEVGVSRRKL